METVPLPASVYDTWHAIPEETIAKWVSQENLASKNTRTFQGFEITDSIDGRPDKDVEVSLVRLMDKGQYPQHVHHKSDAYFIIVSGTAVLLSGTERSAVSPGDRVDIPRGKPHGFELAEGHALEFISIQSPPIKDEHSGEEDFHLISQV
jgi:mannose-6-phosphate isomerase-like protein (cupin superfamily)